jgi:cytochrome c553
MKAGVVSTSLLTLLLASGGTLLAAVAPPAALSFEKDIRPIFKTHCFQCHGEEGVKKGDLDVRLTRFLLQGGESGAAIQPGKPEESPLLQLVRKGEMPKGKTHLSEANIATIQQWIAEGARTLRPEPEKLGPEHAFTDEERAWWGIPAHSATKHSKDEGTRKSHRRLHSEGVGRKRPDSIPAGRSNYARPPFHL